MPLCSYWTFHGR